MTNAEEVVEKIDGRLDPIPSCIVRGQNSLTEDGFQTLGEIGGFWNFDFQNGDWFFNHLEEYTEKCDQEIVEYGPRSKTTSEPLVCKKHQEDIRAKMIKLDSEMKDQDISKLTFDDLEPYLIFLTEHQHASWNHMVNRWGYNPYAKDLRSAREILVCEKVGEQVQRFLEEPYALELDFHGVLSKSWAGIQSGFPDEALKLLEPLCEFYTSIQMKVMEGVSVEYPLLNVLDFSQKRKPKAAISPDFFARYKMSTMIALGKAYLTTGETEKAKDIYRELISSYLEEEVTLGEGDEKVILSPFIGGEAKPKMNYWVGNNRVLESAIELYNLETNSKIKNDLKNIIFMLFKRNRAKAVANEATDSTREPCLVVYMMLKHVYGYLK